jgi:hypothetical protein
LGWTNQPCEIYLDNGTILTPSADDEGNDAGAIFTNIKEMPVLGVFREEIEYGVRKKKKVNGCSLE